MSEQRVEGEACSIVISVSPGELLDRLAILDLKLEFGAASLVPSLTGQASRLRAAAARLARPAGLADAVRRLQRCNRLLWRLEQRVRLCESNRDFGARFIASARLISRLNDRRAALKRRINLLLGAVPDDCKMY